MFRAASQETTAGGVGTRRGIRDHAAAFIDEGARARCDAAARKRALREFDGACDRIDDERAREKSLGERAHARINADEFEERSRAGNNSNRRGDLTAALKVRGFPATTCCGKRDTHAQRKGALRMTRQE